MDEYISRNAAINDLLGAPKKFDEDGYGWFLTTSVYATIEDVPAADVRPVVRGEWVKNEGRAGWHCSSCKVDNIFAYSWNSNTGKNEFQDNFCPNCGADMRGEY